MKLVRLADVPYKGNFNINYHSKRDLEMLQRFFGVRREKFDMALLEIRVELLQEIESYNYDKNSTNRDKQTVAGLNGSTRAELDNPKQGALKLS